MVQQKDNKADLLCASVVELFEHFDHLAALEALFAFVQQQACAGMKCQSDGESASTFRLRVGVDLPC